MRSHAITVLYVILLVAVIVTVDVLFLRDKPWARLAANVAIALVFALVYFKFFNNR